MSALVRLLLIALLLTLPVRAAAQVVSDRPQSVAITVYPAVETYYGQGPGLVMVTEERTVDMPAGRSTLVFRGVAEGIVPQTVAVTGLAAPVSEQNFDYRLLSPGSLIRHAEGEMVSIVRTNPATGQATQERARLVSGGDGALLDFGGRIEALRCSGVPQRIVIDRLPPGYTDRPTLSVETTSASAGRRTVVLSYLATGISWKADYVARIARDRRGLNLFSWITISNASSAQFADAPVQVLAGALERSDETVGQTFSVEPRLDGCWRTNSGRRASPARVVEFVGYRGSPDEIVSTGTFIRGAAEDAALPALVISGDARRENLGDFKLYTLPERTTLAPFQTKQVRMFERRDVDFDWVHRVSVDGTWRAPEPGDGAPAPAHMVLQLKNEEASGLGLPLPAGAYSVFEPGEGDRQRLVGMGGLRNTAEGLPFDLFLGESMGVQSRTEQRSYDRLGERRVDIGVLITNANPSPVTVQVQEESVTHGLQKVLRQSRRSRVRNGVTEWVIIVPANGIAKLTYTLKQPS